MKIKFLCHDWFREFFDKNIFIDRFIRFFYYSKIRIIILFEFNRYRSVEIDWITILPI